MEKIVIYWNNVVYLSDIMNKQKTPNFMFNANTIYSSALQLFFIASSAPLLVRIVFNEHEK